MRHHASVDLQLLKHILRNYSISSEIEHSRIQTCEESTSPYFSQDTNRLFSFLKIPTGFFPFSRYQQERKKEKKGKKGKKARGSCHPTPALWGLFLLRVLYLNSMEVGFFLLSFRSRICLCTRILCRWWTAMRCRSLQTLLAVALDSASCVVPVCVELGLGWMGVLQQCECMILLGGIWGMCLSWCVHIVWHVSGCGWCMF